MKVLSSSYPLKRGRPLKEFDDSLGESTKKRRRCTITQTLRSITTSDEEAISTLVHYLQHSHLGQQALERLKHDSEFLKEMQKIVEKRKLLNEEQVHELEKNVKTLFLDLSPHSHLRQPLIHYLANDIPVELAAKLFNCSESLIKKAKQLTEEEIHQTLLFVKRHQMKGTKHWENNDIHQFKQFLEEFCPPPSGTLKEQFFCTISLDALYEHYCQWRKKANKQRLEKLDEGLRNKIIEALKSEPSTAREHNVFPIHCKKTFINMCREFKIRFYKKNLE
jgi:hypothetical protein